MKARRYAIKNWKTGHVTVFIGGEDARQKRNALELEMEAFESTSEVVRPKCKQPIRGGI